MCARSATRLASLDLISLGTLVVGGWGCAKELSQQGWLFYEDSDGCDYSAACPSPFNICKHVFASSIDEG